MCGIVGFTGDGDPASIKDMAQTLVHRGPDDERFFQAEGIRLGMRRLAIVDLETGRQPVHNEDGTVWAVFNGEIYNHQEIRRELQASGHRFYTDHSDSEVIVHLYEAYGENFVQRINGMFAIAVWDGSQKKLILYRDRLGKKPLYYSLKNGRICFGSEIKALLRLPWVSKELDPVSVSRYFSEKNVSAPRTIFKEIRQLPPAHYLVFSDGQAEVRPYWNIDFSHTLDISEEEAEQEILRILDDSVKIRMDCDVPFGAYLSGGIDSSLVVALMKRHHSKPLKTFSLGYEDEFEHKKADVHYARELSKRLGTEHYEYIMKARELPEMLPQIMGAFDEPFSGTVSTYFLSLLIKQHVKVALSGDGADELFGSYLAHRLAFPIEHFLSLPPAKQRDPHLLSDEERSGLRPFDSPDQYEFLRKVAEPSMASWRAKLNVFLEVEKEKLLMNGFLFSTEPTNGISTAQDPLNRVLEMDQKSLLPNQVLAFVDRLSMAHSIEVRVPFLDYRLVEFAAQLPGQMKINNGITKYILKKAAARFLPEGWVHRPKEGFVLPVYSWMRGALAPFIRSTLSPEKVKRAGFLSVPYVQKLVEDFYHGAKTEPKIWNLVCFMVWWEKYLG